MKIKDTPRAPPTRARRRLGPLHPGPEQVRLDVPATALDYSRHTPAAFSVGTTCSVADAPRVPRACVPAPALPVSFLSGSLNRNRRPRLDARVADQGVVQAQPRRQGRGHQAQEGPRSEEGRQARGEEARGEEEGRREEEARRRQEEPDGEGLRREHRRRQGQEGVHAQEEASRRQGHAQEEGGQQRRGSGEEDEEDGDEEEGRPTRQEAGAQEGRA